MDASGINTPNCSLSSSFSSSIAINSLPPYFPDPTFRKLSTADTPITSIFNMGFSKAAGSVNREPGLVSKDLQHETSSMDTTHTAPVERTKIPGHSIKRLDPKSLDEIVEVGHFLAEAFIEREPLSHALATSSPRVSHDIFHTFSQTVSEKTAANGVTFTAKSTDGTLIGFVMAAPWKEETYPTPPPLGLEPMYDFLDHLESAFCNLQSTSGNAATRRIVEITIGATLGRYEGNHVASELVGVALLHAAQEGYNEVIVKATSQSQFGFQGFGFSILAELSYEDYEFGGNRPFALVKYPRKAKLMWLTYFTTEWPPSNTIVNAINYDLISHQRWSIKNFAYSLML
ncbi:hypothetical protein VN97_g11028 [Penicillium thymicola]|uniref:Uncharacterized protein n=1 Tax=Penicillium thymicola TaxID=293382 RepID=A0AAI9T842_PENTH|nr:hypothetical protein VN97_g11028 [Penicillium thymicola]